MKSKKSKFLLTSLLVIVGTIMLVNSAVAESSKSDTIGGVPVYAFLSKFDYGARARTECGYSQCTAYATAEYRYKFGPKDRTYISTASASGTVAVSAVAESDYVPAVFVSARGDHSIFFVRGTEHYKWGAETNL